MIEVEHLTKYYGNFLAVNDLSFKIEDGHVYGLLGPNGAGKSTTMNILTGCLSLSEGTVKIGGHDILEEAESAKRLIGYLPEQPPLYLNETVVEYLTFVCEAKGVKGADIKNQISEVINKVGLNDVKDRIINKLSKGYKQRVGIAQALLGNPEIIILDEPTVGLDPIQIIEIREFIKNLGKEHTVILSSHILSEVQAVCEEVLIISKGKLVAFDTPDNLEKLMMTSGGIVFEVKANEEEIAALLSSIVGIKSFNVTSKNDSSLVEVTLNNEVDSKEVCGNITIGFAKKDIAVFEMHTNKANLEDVFLELTESSNEESEAKENDSDIQAWNQKCL